VRELVKKKSLTEIKVNGKKVLMRVDFNVPLDDGTVRDDTRIRAALPTINHLLENGARLSIVSHLGRPKGQSQPGLKMDPVAKKLAGLLGRTVLKLDQVIGPEVEKAVNAMRNGDLIMLENVRFEKGEENNDPDFARILAAPFDLFINDAFGTAHRAHASTVGVADYIPAVAGLLMEKEIRELSRCLDEPVRPLVAILGGAKVSDKIGVVHRFLQLADTLMVGGGMANTFLAAKGLSLGSSFYEKEQLQNAVQLLHEAENCSCNLVLPVDLVVTRKLEQGSPNRVMTPQAIDGDWKAVDIGQETAALFGLNIKDAGMVLWNGPLGVFEIPPYEQGTAAITRAIAESGAYSVIGGGDLVAAVESLGLTSQISFISTGGGATLEFWEGKELPGISVLQ
jgi:phosphoglycerate kinase